MCVLQVILHYVCVLQVIWQYVCVLQVIWQYVCVLQVILHYVCVLQVIWQYVSGMLTNLDSLPLKRIHNMLRMFASSGPGPECTERELQAFLEKKVREQKLTFSQGVYRLCKS